MKTIVNILFYVIIIVVFSQCSILTDVTQPPTDSTPPTIIIIDSIQTGGFVSDFGFKATGANTETTNMIIPGYVTILQPGGMVENDRGFLRINTRGKFSESQYEKELKISIGVDTLLNQKESFTGPWNCKIEILKIGPNVCRINTMFFVGTELVVNNSKMYFGANWWNQEQRLKIFGRNGEPIENEIKCFGVWAERYVIMN